jgi:TM2 domain-containing membrane protein YozV
MLNDRFIAMLPGLQPEEMIHLENLTRDLNQEQMSLFISLYSTKRKTAETVLICTILGFVVIAGIQRFVLGQIGMGLLYLFTGGLCLVGTIVDLINHKDMVNEYNQRVALETMAMIRR